MTQRERLAWSFLLHKFGLMDAYHLDSFHQVSDKRFTWWNQEYGEHSCETRIDRYHINQTLADWGGAFDTMPWQTHLTDHAIILLKFNTHSRRPKRRPVFNPDRLAKAEDKEACLNIWQRAIRDTLGSIAEKVQEAVRSTLHFSAWFTKDRKTDGDASTTRAIKS